VNRLDPALIRELNLLAVDGLADHPGEFRKGPAPIFGSKHDPPDAGAVPRLVDEMCALIVAEWKRDVTWVAAYALWRINWIHPFEDGNGRTARAVAYLIVCARNGAPLPGRRTLPERIKDEKRKYWRCLGEADKAWKRKRLDVSHLTGFLEKHLEAQLSEPDDETSMSNG
jgi:Fic family protein